MVSLVYVLDCTVLTTVVYKYPRFDDAMLIVLAESLCAVADAQGRDDRAGLRATL